MRVFSLHMVFCHTTKRAVTTFDPPYPKTPYCMQISRLCVLQNRSYCRSKLYIVGITIFEIFAPVTLTLTRWPSYTNLTRIPSRCTGCAKMNFVIKSRISKVIVWQTYINTVWQTDALEIIYHAASRVVKITVVWLFSLQLVISYISSSILCNYSVFQKSDAKIQIIIIATNLIRIKYPLSIFNYHLSGANVANFNKIHCTLFEQQLFKKWNSKTEVSNMEKSP